MDHFFNSMMVLKFFKRLWNGGLNPALADPTILGERRTVAAVGFVFVPSALLLVISHLLLFDTNYHRVIVISLTMFVGLFALYAQAYKGWSQTAALSIIIALWIAPVTLMVEEGFSSSNWAWLLPVILLANFLLSRKASIVVAGLSVLVLGVVGVLTLQGWLGYDIDAAEHGMTIAISGSLIIILACTLGYSYRTSQIKSQHQLMKNMQVLATEVDTRRTAELKALAGERAKATFLTTVSHELRTPLNGVIGASDLLANKELDEDTQELVSIIKNSGEILLDVINNVLDLSRLDEGKLDLEKEVINIRDVIKSCFDPLQVLSQAKNIELMLTIDDAIPSYYLTDPSRIRQLILNIAGNAIKFTRKGYVRISITLQDSTIKLSIQDTGIGIAEEKLQEIFLPFSQADSSVDRQFGGSGLGLSIVDRLVKLFGGTIEVDSELDKGTCFTVLLPLEPCAPPESLEPMEEQDKVNTSTQDSATVLVTDDNVINRKVASQLLRQLGHKVIEASDGLEALVSIERGNIDVVLMDVQMPNMDGITATGKIREMNSPLCKTPIIGVSANAMPSAESEMLEAGMDGYLPKPVRLGELKSALGKAMVNNVS